MEVFWLLGLIECIDRHVGRVERPLDPKHVWKVAEEIVTRNAAVAYLPVTNPATMISDLMTLSTAAIVAKVA